MVGTPLEFDTILDLCGDRHRRIVLAELAARQRSLTIDDLTRAIVKHNHHVPLTEVSGETLTRIETSLHHVHIPKLEAVGLVEYNSVRELVEPTPEFDRVEPHLSSVLDADPVLATPLEGGNRSESTADSHPDHRTVTTSDRTRDGARSTEGERAVEILAEALETEAVNEKDYQIWEALQLLTLQGDC